MGNLVFRSMESKLQANFCNVGEGGEGEGDQYFSFPNISQLLLLLLTQC